MPRGPLTPAQKRAMQAARQRTRKQRADALEALNTNEQFTNFKLWKKVDSERQNAILEAIEKAQQWAKRQRIDELRQEIEKLESEL